MEISPAELKEKLADTELLLLDVRTPAEYASCHVRGALNVPLDELRHENVTELSRGKSVIATICQSGKRGARAAEQLRGWGLERVSNVSGGTASCKLQGLPVVETQSPVISLERQVRIAAGGLVLIGVLLAHVLSFSWIYLSAFVGAGLIFAGVTDSCGMAMLLAKMPWNQVKNEKRSCSL